MSEEELVAESDKSPGVLLSSGYIAGGAIAGIIVAIVQGVLNPEGWFPRTIAAMADRNPFATGNGSDVLSLLPYGLLCGFLYLVARGKLLAK